MPTPRQTLTGDDFGAIAYSDLTKLYTAQREAVVEIISAIHAIAIESYQNDPRDDEATLPSSLRDLKRPHHSFLINGIRGSGKTTTLVTLRAYLARLRLNPNRMQRSTDAEIEVANTVIHLALEAVKGPDGDKSVGLVIPVVFSEDMEDGESPMDAVLALMQHEIELQHEVCAPS